MTEKVKLTKEQADAVDSLLENLKGMRFTELFKALQYGYEVGTEYKAGDWVVRITDGKDPRKAFAQERVFQINRIGGTLAWCTNEFGHTLSHIRHATPEEIKAEKERQMWKKIGRKVGEFRIGDIRILDDGNSVHITDVDYARAKYIQGTLNGFYPAESFIKFES